jgi:hypothetical protein
MKSLFPLLSLGLLFGSTLSAQTVVKCCGTQNSTFLLGNTSYARHTQSLYLPSDLTNAADGTIHRLYFRYGDTGEDNGVTLTNFVIHLGQTPDTAFANGNTFFTGLQQVQAGPALNIQPGTTGDWFSFPITPFDYDATQTLIVDIWYMGSDNTAFGTLGTDNNGRKLYANDMAQTTGATTSTVWQDIGFDLDPSTAVNGPQAASFTLLPLPGRGQWQLLPGEGTAFPAEMLLYGATGKLLWNRTVANAGAGATVDLSPFSSGLYLLQLRTRDGKASIRRLLLP